jgi:hypothetical protein
VRDAAAPCYKIAVLALLYEKQQKAFSSKAPNQLSEAAQIKNKNTTTVKTLNLLSNARIKPSFFRLLRSSDFPKRKTKKLSFFNLLRKPN